MAINIEDVSDELKGLEGYDRESRVARSLTVAKSLLDMDYDVYANELMVHLEFCRLFRDEYEAATGKQLPLDEIDSAEHDLAFHVVYFAALCYTAGKLEGSLPAWVLGAKCGDRRGEVRTTVTSKR